MKLTTIVMSAWRSNQDLITNMEATNALRHYLNTYEIQHWDAVGAYKEEGQSLIQQEVSHIIHCKNDNDVTVVCDMAKDLNQDCVLMIDSNNNAMLVFPNDKPVSLGILTVVSEDEAKTSGHYTYFLGEYYICK